MEAVQYNGVNLQCLQTLRFHRQQERDKADNYIRTRWEVETIASYSPGATSYAFGDGPPANPGIVAIPGKLPGATDLATLERLLTPRGLLIVTAGGSVVLETPALKNGGPARYETDTLNGPFCEFVSAPQQIGIRHWLVHLRFLAHTVECVGQSEVVLSNTWSTAWDVDELWQPVKTVAGTAILRTDIMRDRHITADSLRGAFFFAIPPNYVRENIQVELSEDGATLLYSFTDTARYYNVNSAVPGNSEIRKCDVYRSSYSVAGSPTRGSREWTLAQRILTWDGPGSAAAALYNIGWHAATFGNGSEGRRLANLPSHVFNVRCDIWGDRDSSMRNLTSICLGICLQNTVFEGIPFSLSTAEVSIAQEITARYVSCQVTYKWADNLQTGTPQINAIISQDQGGGAIVLNAMVNDEWPAISRKDLGNQNAYITLTQTTGQNPAPSQNAFGILSRNVLQESVVQALLDPCSFVPTPNLTGPKS